jgi:hypothetical protein
MSKKFFMLTVLVVSALAPAAARGVRAGQQAGAVKSVEITPATVESEVGKQVKLTAVGKDAAGNPVEQKPSAWFALPSDIASADETGTVTLYQSGIVRVGTIIGGKLAWARITIKPARVAAVKVEAYGSPVVGGVSQLQATARSQNGNPRSDAAISWTSDNPEIATVDAAGLVMGIKPGRATIKAMAEGATGTVTIDIAPNPIASLWVEPRTINARTGDVVRFAARAKDASGGQVKHPSVRWAVSGEGAIIEPDGGFVAERPGTYVVTALGGERAAVASVVVTPRAAEREIEVVGRAPFKEFQAAEQWIFGKYAYVSTIADKLLVYDISDPSSPKLTETVKFDARILNDFSTTADGKIGVISREGASNRKNGIAFLDMSDPAHPKVISEYTETVTGGVHSAFVEGHYVYLTDDATGSMRVIDFKDVKKPKEVARWEVENVLVKPAANGVGDGSLAGRYLHDVQVVDGLAYLAYWRDGLVILDVGKGIKGGSPEKPMLVSNFRFNHSELYGNGWIAGSHAVFRYKNYVFVGDEVFPEIFNIQDRARFPVRGIVHVIDVSDISNPRKVAEYVVPEAGSHNIWVKDDVLYMGYYSGGGRIVDVSGELRGELYRQGREIGRVWTGDINGFRSNQPLTWGAQPVGDLIYFNDINTGLWIVKLGKPKDKGSTTAPGN